MKKLLRNIVLLLSMNLLAGMLLLIALNWPRDYEQWETDSLLENFPQDQPYGLVILGPSRANFLARFRAHHQCLENNLNMTTYNLGLPAGGGIFLSKMFYQHFTDAGNRADRLLIFVDPFTFFNEGANERHKFVYYEPLRVKFLYRLVKEGYGWKRIFTYIRSKCSWQWLTRKKEPMDRLDRSVKGPIEPDLVEQRIGTLYVEAMEESVFQRYAGELKQILASAKRQNTEVFMILPPTLLGPEPGAPQLLQLIDELRADYEFTFSDFTNSISDPVYYKDLDHLNTPGTCLFIEEFLAPMLLHQARP